MGNRAVVKRHLDPDIFKSYIKSKGLSIRQLGNLVDTNEKTIRRIVQQQEVSLNVAIDLCIFFGCTFDDLFGPDNTPGWSRDRLRILKMLR